MDDPRASSTSDAGVAAAAKINLALHVVGRRADGYHLLDSLVAFASVGDRLTAKPADHWHLSVSGPFAGALPPSGDDNLALRAAKGAAAALGFDQPCAVHLHKVLPVASGIGGGSADAAAAIRAVEAVASQTIAEPARAALALALGADVPVCLGGRPARMSGIGERLTPWGPLPPAGLVLANPLIAVPTAGVFRALAGQFGRDLDHEDGLPARADFAALIAVLAPLRNDLQAPAAALVPEISTLLGALQACDEVALARMSGSGATCFGLTRDQAAAEAVVRHLAARYPHWWFAAGTMA